MAVVVQIVHVLTLPIQTSSNLVCIAHCCILHWTGVPITQREYAKSLPFNSDAKAAIAKQNELLMEMIQEVQSEDRRRWEANYVNISTDRRVNKLIFQMIIKYLCLNTAYACD